jgi:hypothetical protein
MAKGFIKTFWANLSFRNKKLVFVAVLGILPTIASGIKLVQITRDWWNEESTSFQALTGVYFPPPVEKLSKEEAEDFKSFHLMTCVSLPNATSMQLNRVVVVFCLSRIWKNAPFGLA